MTRTLSLSQRRLATVLQMVSYPILFFTMRWMGLASSLATIVGLLPFVGLSVYLYRGTQLWQFGNAPDEQLDERQVLVRNRAYQLAYAIVSAVIVSLLVYLMLAADFHWPVLSGYDQLNPFFWGVWIVVLVLPSAILAWTESEI
ncbi:hypothetical protein [uncultured Fibrella sp.]|uniref:hypothetical protein n=1 Tax=uncultured Fibrella sp. TaxID=1284596 RepID=UPI0035CB78C8